MGTTNRKKRESGTTVLSGKLMGDLNDVLVEERQIKGGVLNHVLIK